MAITIRKSGKTGAPVVFGASETVNKGVEVKFGFGTLTNVLSKIGGEDDGIIYFGYDENKSTGAIVSRGKLVSSKILDIKTSAAVTAEDGSVTKESLILISYVDVDKSIKVLEIPVSADAKLKDLSDRLTTIETLVGSKTDTKDKNTIFGTIAKEVDRATVADTSLDNRVTTIENLITSDKDGTINKVSEVIDWFKGVSEGEGGAKLLADVAANKTAIGTEKTDNAEATGIYKRLEDIEAKKHAKSDVSVDTGKYVSGVHVDELGVLTIDLTALTADGIASTAIEASDKTVAVEGDKVALQIASLAKSIKSVADSADNAIKELDVTDAAEEGKYVSAVSQKDGKITVTHAELPKLSVKDNSTQYVTVDNHEVGVKTSSLNTVGLVKNDSGKWVAGTVDKNSTGLATAADVAGEIISDEKVIAAAFNDHELRLNKVENKAITVTSTKTDVNIDVAEVKDASNNVTTAATTLNVKDGKVTFTVHNGDTDVEETITAYTEDTVKALVELYAKEKARAEAAESALDLRLQWIDVE